MGIPDHLTCMQVKKQQLDPEIEQWTSSKLGKNNGPVQNTSGCILLPCLFNFYAGYIMRNAGLDEAQAGIKIAGRNINMKIADMQMTSPLWQKVKRN